MTFGFIALIYMLHTPAIEKAELKQVSICDIKSISSSLVGKSVKIRAIMLTRFDGTAIFTDRNCPKTSIYDVTEYDYGNSELGRFGKIAGPDVGGEIESGRYDVYFEGKIVTFKSEPSVLTPWEPIEKLGVKISKIIHYKKK